MKLMAFDPSGNHGKEGNGTTGWAYFEGHKLVQFGDVKAKNHTSFEDYVDTHINLIDNICGTRLADVPDVVVYETYRLQAGKALQQSWSELLTAQLIGALRYHCWRLGIPCEGQDPTIKARFSDDILVEMEMAERRKGGLYIKGFRTNEHMRDAIRHALYYIRYGKENKT